MSDAAKPAPTPLIEKLRRMEEMARQAEYGFGRLFGLTDAATLRDAIAALSKAACLRVGAVDGVFLMEAANFLRMVPSSALAGLSRPSACAGRRWRFLFENHQDERAGGHEGAEIVEERLAAMDGIEALGLRFGDGLLLDGDDLEAGLFDFGENGSGVAFADCVRLDDAEGALRHGVCSWREILLPSHCNGRRSRAALKGQSARVSACCA